MGEKKSGGGWLKNIPGLGKKKLDEKPAKGSTEAAPPQEKSAPPQPRLHRNPLMPKQQSGNVAPSADPSPGVDDKPQAPLSDIILVIDDSEIDRMIIEELLTDAGYEVIQAVDGEDGVEKFRKHHPALVITDMIMPGMNGTEVILKVRAESSETKIIALSAGGELGPDVALTVPKSLQIQTLAKPVDPDILLEAVKAHYK